MLRIDARVTAPDTGARLGAALLAYMLGVTLMITLLPFQFGWPAQWRVVYIVVPTDVVANIVLFIPLGFFYRLALHSWTPSTLHVLVAGALASGAIEALQLFEDARFCSPVDVASNSTGALLGALGAQRVASSARVDGRLVGWLALELPLMGLVYLLVPLLWINSLAAAGDGMRSVTVLLLGLFGANVLGGIQRHYFANVPNSDARRTAVFAALWFIAGAFYAMRSRPVEILGGAAAVAALTWWLGRRGVRGIEYNRRFEVPVLKSGAPAYAVYLALITVAPLGRGIAEWTLHAGFPTSTAEQVEILRLLELAAAFTLAGYMIAEFRGRVVATYGDALPRLFAWSAVLAVAVEITRGYEAGQGASLARGALLVAAALYGGWLYYLQRAHVMRLLTENVGHAQS
jgi:VanZ family protein